MINGDKNTQNHFIHHIVQVKKPEDEQIWEDTQNKRDIYEQLYDHMSNIFFENEVSF